MKIHIQSLGLASALAVLHLSAAMGSPVTANDITGKKICWDNGNISTFNPGGHYSSPVVGEGTWAVTASGVALYTAGFNGILDIDKQPGGIFKSQREGGVGRYCR